MPRPKGKRQCCVDGCDNEHRALGFCITHHKQWQNGKLPEQWQPKRVNGVEPDWPYDFQNVDGIWFRSVAGQNDWREVTWEDTPSRAR